jgi:hypothetical protein
MGGTIQSGNDRMGEKMRRRLGLTFMCTVVLGASTVPGALGQITDPEQRKAWFYLQHVAGEAAELSNCILEMMVREPKFNPKESWMKYYTIADELGREIE